MFISEVIVLKGFVEMAFFVKCFILTSVACWITRLIGNLQDSVDVNKTFWFNLLFLTRLIFSFNCKHFLKQWKIIIKNSPIKNHRDLKFNDNQIFEILIIHKPSLGSRDVPYKIWSRSVQPFWRFWIQTDRQAKFIYIEVTFYLKILNGTLLTFFLFFYLNICYFLLGISIQVTGVFML